MDDADHEDDWDSNPVNQLLLDCVKAPSEQRAERLEGMCREHPEHAAELRRRFANAVKMGLVSTPASRDKGALQTVAGPTTRPGAQRTIGPYRILEELGRGGQAVVYLAEHGELGRKVALKVLASVDGAALASDSRLTRFRREAEVTSRLDHPSICSVYEAGEENGLAWIAMRFVPGQTLGQRIARSRERQQDGADPKTHAVTLPESSGDLSDSQPPSSSAPVRGDLLRAVVLIERVARALHVAHEHGLVHRDIKPGNIMVTGEGEPVLLDFGMARDEESLDFSLTQPGELMGTPYYMSPEQLLAKRVPLDRRTDIYSLGVTLYECATLRRAFDAPTREGLYQQICFEDPPDPRRYNKHIPRDLKVILEAATCSNPARRYETALDFAEDLRRFRAFEAIRARPTGALLRATRWVQRHRVASAFFLLITVALAVTSWLLVEVSLRERRVRALSLVAAAKDELKRDATLALLLAREAVRLDASHLDLFHRVLAERIPVAEVRHPVHPTELWGSAHFSRDGRRILTMSEKRSRVAVWGVDGTLLTTIEPASKITEWMIAPDGRHVVLRCAKPPVGIWSVREGLAGRDADIEIAEESDPVLGFRPAPGSDGFLLARESGALELYDWKGQARSLRASGPRQTAIAHYARAGDRIVFGCADGHLEFRTMRGELIRRVQVAETPVVSSGASGSLETVVARIGDGRPLVWREGGDRVTRLVPPPQSGACGVLVSPTGDRVLSFHSMGAVRVWGADGSDLGRVEGNHSWRGTPWTYWRAHAFSPSGEHFITLDAGFGLLRVFRKDGGVEFRLKARTWKKNMVRWLGGGYRFLFSHGATASILNVRGKELFAFRSGEGFVHTALAPDQRRFCTLAEDARLSIWSIERDDLPAWSHPGGHDVLSLAISPDGTLVATAHEGGDTRISTRDGREVARFPGVSKAPISGVSFSPDGRRVAISEIPWIRVFDIASKEELFSRKHVKGCANFVGVRFSPVLVPGAGELLSTQNRTGPAFALSLADAAKAPTLFRDEGDGLGNAWTARYSKSGDLVVTTHMGKRANTTQLACWNRAGDLLWSHTINGPRWPNDAAFSPDGSFVLASYDGRVELRNAKGLLVRSIGHPTAAVEVDFAADGRRFVTVDTDQAVRIWTLEGVLLATLRGHTGRVTGAVFTPDGTRLLTSSRDGTVRTWYANNDELKERAFASRVRDFTRREREKYGELLGAR